MTIDHQRTPEVGEAFDPAAFDHFSQEYAERPEGVWAALREIAGLARSERYGGFRIISRYDEICAAARNPAVFASGQGVAIPDHQMPPLIPVGIDPPLHGQYRKVLLSDLGPPAIARKEAEYRELADQLLAQIGEGEFDFCAAFSSQFPERVALRTIGFDLSDRERMSAWFHDMTHLRGIDDEAVGAAIAAMFGRVAEVVAQRRAEPRRDDLLSTMLDGEVDGRALRDDEILMYIALLLFGGLDTTASAIAGAFHYLAQHPEDRARLLADEVALDRAVEEFVRWTSPVQALARTVTEPIELGGCPLEAGEKVLLLWGAGNRDDTVFESPDEIRLDRFPNRHLGFGMGPHRCMGSHLAKVMVKIAIERGVKVLGDFELADPARVRWATGEARGIVELPLRRR
ncbi:cytochrome P450 [Pseudonocardia spinosispora]|uniref:cytochrome P450 n=1 Tax=Pseudonocardia spinosispora TaxID=103441 RepID=UPI00041A6806|nr:cytochrome P450 [Pseudonocardia spinosispora]